MTKNNSLMMVFVALEALLLLNLILIPKLYIVYIFTGIFVFIIYRKFAKDFRSFLYFSTLVFSLVYLSLYMPLGRKYSIYYFYVSLFIYTIIYFIDILRNRDKVFNKNNIKNKYVIFFFTFAVYAVFSIVLASHKFTAIKSVIVYAIMFCFMLMIVNENRDMNKIKTSLKLLEYVYTGIIVLGTLEVFGLKFGLRSHFLDYGITYDAFPFVKRIPIVFFYNPNNYAVFLVMAMSLIYVAYILSDSKRRRMYLSVLFFVSQVNLIFTTSRTAWISIFFIFAFAYVILIFAKQKQARIRTIKFAVATLLVFFIFSLFPFMASYYGKFATLVYLIRDKVVAGDIGTGPALNIGENGSMNNRFTILYDVFMGVFKKGHVLGFGAGNTVYYIESVKNTFGVINIHSLLFEILGDFGIPICLFSAGIYLSLIVDNIKTLFISKGKELSVPLMLASCLFGFMFLSFGPSTVITFIPFWLMLGVSAAAVMGKKEL